MKKLIPLVALLLASLFSTAQVSWKAAQEKAKKEERFILLNFSGSDWCVPCIQMQESIFTKAEFMKMADSQLVVVRADFPRKKKNKPAADIVLQNEMLADKFNPNGNFPYTLLMDADGKIIKSWDGKPDETAAVFAANVKELIQQYKAK